MDDKKTITITIEEYNLLLENQKQVDELKDLSWIVKVHKYCVGAKHCQNQNEIKQQAVKDTAREILGLILAKEFEKGDYLTDNELHELFKEKYGVEVE